ncbi:MAG: TerC family protein [Alphaproteobacteria bacterium]|nr:TerC family protein [Alphaproteobacteria bacterium]
MTLASELAALGQVLLIDLVLAADNAIIVGMVAARLPKEQRARVIMIGILAATIMRIGFAVVTSHLLQIIGLTLAGGILLLWVCWKLWREIRATAAESHELDDPTGERPIKDGEIKTTRQAIIQIVLADISMSLDNVLAVAGAAGEHTWVLIMGLTLSVAFMGIAATLIARILKKYHWLSYVGLITILYVSLKMIWEGSEQVFHF